MSKEYVQINYKDKEFLVPTKNTLLNMQKKIDLRPYLRSGWQAFSSSSACDLIILGNLVFIVARIKLLPEGTASGVKIPQFPSQDLVAMPEGITILNYSDWTMAYDVAGNTLDSLPRAQVDSIKNKIVNFSGPFITDSPYNLSCYFWADIDESIVFNWYIIYIYI